MTSVGAHVLGVQIACLRIELLFRFRFACGVVDCCGAALHSTARLGRFAVYVVALVEDKALGMSIHYLATFGSQYKG
ncbi:unnamed protein product [Periconia digitata]|uniref:Uncharacterized protein n=1 Tax=Periconia digitata TaxID=1303443 RepID=A0A9W4UN27_9PLEO|nr:unnamed protein product [Periconia digitata]